MHRKVIAGLLLFCVLSSLTAWGCEDKKREQTRQGKRLTIICSFYPVYITTLNVVEGIEGVEVSSLLPSSGEGCLHDYHLTPSDMSRLKAADVLVINGGGMENFVTKATQVNPDLKIIDASRGIKLMMGDKGPNPHLWGDPELVGKQAWIIAQELAKIDEANAAGYSANARSYAAALIKLKKEFQEDLASCRGSKVLVLHGVFSYLASALGLQLVGELEDEPEMSWEAGRVAEMIDRAKATGVDCILAPEQSAAKAEALGRELKASVVLLDTLTGGVVRKDAYVMGMRENVRRLKEGMVLNGGS